MTIPAGTRLGPYEVIAPLGAGGMGEVYRARDTRLDREVALKVVASRHGEDPAALRRFAREAKIAARLTHPNVCTLYDADTDGALAYAVLELLEGETLAARIARGPLSEEETRRAGADVARGLARAHALGFVHRDLKPQNVFLTASGSKILDFGLARPQSGDAGGDEETASLLTEAGRILGTVGYMSPEQIRGEPPAAASDLWALGCVLFECLAGRRPFRGRTAQEVFAATLTEPPGWTALPPGVSPAMRDLLARLLDRDAATRLSDAGTVERLLSSDRVTSSPALDTPRPARRRLGVLAAAALGVLAVAALGLWLARGRGAPIDSLAVLPFSSSGSDAELADVLSSLADDVIGRISQAPNLRVTASSAVARYAGHVTDPLAVARELGVRAVLTGRVVGRAGRVSVTTELVDASNGRRLWGERYERSLSGLSVLGSEISSALAARLRLVLSDQDRARLARQDTASPEAYELWLRGRRVWSQRWTTADLEQALAYFEKALDADPRYARAWAGVAATWDVFGYTDRRPVPDAYEKAKAAAKKALEIDPDLAEAHAVLAHATMLTGDDAAAERGFRRALALDANSLDAIHWYSHLLMKEKRWDESLALSKRLLELDPLGWWNIHLGEHYRAKGDRDLSLAHFRRAVELDSGNAAAHSELGKTLLEYGRASEALPELEAAYKADPTPTALRDALAAAYEKLGRPADAARVRAAGAPAP